MTRTRHAIVVVLALVALAGCGRSGGGQVDQAAADKVADQARTYIDELAAMLGTEPEVRQNVLVVCGPADSDSSKELAYGLLISSQPGARDRLLTEIGQEWESRGWTARTGGATDLALLKGSFAMDATVSTDETRAAVGGSGGCVDQPD